MADDNDHNELSDTVFDGKGFDVSAPKKRAQRRGIISDAALFTSITVGANVAYVLAGMAGVRFIDDRSVGAAVGQVIDASWGVLWKTALGTTAVSVLHCLYSRKKLSAEHKSDEEAFALAMETPNGEYDMTERNPMMLNIARRLDIVAAGIALTVGAIAYGDYSSERALEEYKKQAQEKTQTLNAALAPRMLENTYVFGS